MTLFISCMNNFKLGRINGPASPLQIFVPCLFVDWCRPLPPQKSHMIKIVLHIHGDLFSRSLLSLDLLPFGLPPVSRPHPSPGSRGTGRAGSSAQARAVGPKNRNFSRRSACHGTDVPRRRDRRRRNGMERVGGARRSTTTRDTPNHLEGATIVLMIAVDRHL